MYCKSCGSPLIEGSKFCTACGEVVDDVNRESDDVVNTVSNDAFSSEYDTAGVRENINSTGDDIKDNKVMAVLSYIGILVLIPIFAAKNSKYAQYHAKQGMTLFCLSLGYSIVTVIINYVVGMILPSNYSLVFGYTPNPIASFISIMLSLGSLVFLVFAIVGIVNASSGKCTKLPIIGNIDILGKFVKG